jgi:hypothetical protein
MVQRSRGNGEIKAIKRLDKDTKGKRNVIPFYNPSLIFFALPWIFIFAVGPIVNKKMATSNEANRFFWKVH